jgi:hypothetical protein
MSQQATEIDAMEESALRIIAHELVTSLKGAAQRGSRPGWHGLAIRKTSLEGEKLLGLRDATVNPDVLQLCSRAEDRGR